MTKEKIISLLPYSAPFLFVDDISEVDEYGIKGSYTFKREEYFYQGHFKNNPITPGVILTEVMAQLGLVAFGIYLIGKNIDGDQALQFAMVENHINFYIPVLPATKVIVESKKVYFRFGKLKCKVSLKNTNGDLICDGFISGMIIKNKT